MINTDYFKGKTVTVAGLARSGLACANLLFDLGAKVRVTDHKDTKATREYAAKLKSKQIILEIGRHTKDFLKESDLLVISPGLTNNALPIVWAEELGIPSISEIELAWSLCPATVIAITGSNGKTTVTTLIGKILEAAARNAFVCGNIGMPFSAEVEKMKPGDYACLEASSFQLEHIKNFKPRIAVILNFTANHLDRHQDAAEYLAAKKRIFMNQDNNDYLVLNLDDAILREVAGSAKSGVLYFSQEDGLNQNESAVLCIGSILGIERKLILDVFKGFKGIEHRMEYVASVGGVKFINDSKSTTADSTLWALKNIEEPVILIAGGKDKGVDYSLTLSLARQKVKNLILIGEARERIGSIFKDSLPIDYAESIEKAVNNACSKAKPGDCVLLSPMCSSFDMFSDYEERGNRFKEEVYRLKEKGALQL